MYEAYWQLHARPFENFADAQFYYPSEVHQGALLKLRYAVESRRGAAELLAGAAGVGKTLLLQSLKRQLGNAHTPYIHLVFPRMSPGELLSYLAAELGALSGGAAAPIDESVRRLQTFLADNTRARRHAVIAVDEAQLLIDSDSLEILRLLLNLEVDAQPALTLLLAGQPQLLPALARLPDFEARLGVKCLLRPLDLEETVSYVNHRLKAAGSTHEIFTSEALAALHELTGGNPRRINRLCDLALLIGYAEEQMRINAPQIEAVCNELVAVTPE